MHTVPKILGPALLLGPSLVRAAFGVVSSGGQYIVDAGSTPPLIFKINQAGCDIASISYQGLEYQYPSKSSSIGSGLSGVTVSATTYPHNFVKITCTTSTLTHYYVVKNGSPVIYMATSVTAPPATGELFFHVRLSKELLPTGNPDSYTDLGVETVDGVAVDANGHTYSRFYSNKRALDLKITTLKGTGVYASLIHSGLSQETSAGGPFKREITSERTDEYHSIYWYMYSKDLQPETMRFGLYGPVGLVFSQAPPTYPIDVSFFASLGVSGYTPPSGRGTVEGTALGISSTFQVVLHWYNSNSQYWAVANSSGAFTSPAMKPGSYTMKLYRDEYEVAKITVTVATGLTTTADIEAEPSGTPLWTIGQFNGQPKGFENADLQTRMHPIDTRMSAWIPTTFVVGQNLLSVFPMAQVKGLNDPTTLIFTLPSALGVATLKIGATLSFSSGRAQVQVNDWLSPAPAAPPTFGTTRGLTRGTYRGLNHVYSFVIPSGVLVAGTNTIKISTISGSSGSVDFLAPHFIYDAVALFAGNV